MKSLLSKFNTYEWQGINAQGLRVTGISENTNIPNILAELHAKMITPLSVRKKLLILRRPSKIKTTQLLDFTRQLAMLINSNISLVPALKIIQQGEKNSTLLQLLDNIKIAVESGQRLSETLAKYPRYFDSLYCNLIFVGEQSGTLGIILQQIVQHQEKITQLSHKIKKALTYPIAVIAVAIAVISILLIFVVPQFQPIFQEFGAALPAYTQFVISLAAKIKYFPLCLISTAVILGIAWQFGKKRNLLDAFLLCLPGSGKILHDYLLARFARTLAITSNASLPLVEALTLVANSSGNFIYAQAILNIQLQVTQGQSLPVALQTAGLFPERMTQMIAIAEESGNLAIVLAKLADFYEQKVDQATENLTKLLEPAIMIILGIVIGGLIVAMYLPIFKLGNAI